jgi:heme A synthase
MMIEWTHRLLAALVGLTVLSVVVAAYRHRGEPEIDGPRGVLHPATLALVLVIAVMLLGMVTVKLGNPPAATAAHWTLALATLAVIATTAIRAGAVGGASAAAQRGTPRAVRSLGAGAALAFVVVVLGGLVAKYPGASVACPGFPLCGRAPNTPAGPAHLQMTHRIFAYLLLFHITAIALSISRRASEAPVVQRAAKIAAGLVLLQLGLGAAMIMSLLAPSLRSLHQAVGIGVWLTLFTATYLARTAAEGSRLEAGDAA